MWGFRRFAVVYMVMYILLAETIGMGLRISDEQLVCLGGLNTVELIAQQSSIYSLHCLPLPTFTKRHRNFSSRPNKYLRNEGSRLTA